MTIADYLALVGSGGLTLPEPCPNCGGRLLLDDPHEPEVDIHCAACDYTERQPDLDWGD